MSQSRNLIIIAIVGLVGLGALYSYADTQVKKAINLVHESRERVAYSDDSSIFSSTANLFYVFRLENPTDIDILYSSYYEVYFEGTYITTFEFEILVPAKRSITVDVTAFVGTEGVEALEDLYWATDGEIHYEGSFSGKGTYLLFTISKSWNEEWDRLQ